jgi:hypothetical protein
MLDLSWQYTRLLTLVLKGTSEIVVPRLQNASLLGRIAGREKTTTGTHADVLRRSAGRACLDRTRSRVLQLLLKHRKVEMELEEKR